MEALSYVIILAIIAALLLIYEKGVRPIKKACDGFAMAYLALYQETVGGAVPASGIRYIQAGEEGGVRLLPLAEQDPAVARALERTASQAAQTHFDQMRQALEGCFDAIGNSERYRNLYFQPLNEIYALAHYFIVAGRQPEQIVKQTELADAEGFMQKHKQVCQQLARRLSREGLAKFQAACQQDSPGAPDSIQDRAGRGGAAPATNQEEEDV